MENAFFATVHVKLAKDQIIIVLLAFKVQGFQKEFAIINAQMEPFQMILIVQVVT